MSEAVIIRDAAKDWADHLEIGYRKDLSRLNRNFPFERSILIDMGNLPSDLFMDLLGKPDKTLDDVRSGILDSGLMKSWDKDPFTLNIRFKNHPQKLLIKDLTSSRVGRFVSFEGIVRRVQSTKPSIISAAFECPCGRRINLPQTTRDLTSPIDQCTCGRKAVQYKLVPERCRTLDSQVLIIQEAPDKVTGSEIPSSVSVILRDDLCKQVNAGNRVYVTGILKTYQINPKDKVLNVEFDASYVEVIDREFFDIEISESEEIAIQEIAKDVDCWDKIVKSIAPSVYGSEDIKEAIALQLFGGVSEYNSDGTWQRGDIHVLLIGDPGIAKSKIMDAVLNLCPKGIMTSGRGSSTAGLTAAAVHDGDGGWTLDAGAAVLADRGQLLIDEMDKMTADDRSALHRAMEQQEVPINKAGINTVLKSRCSILAAANPIRGRFEDYEDLAGQFNLAPTLLSRFDLIFICRDVPNADKDYELAEFILSRSDSQKSMLTPDFLRKYISYAKQGIRPVLTEGARRQLSKFYSKLRGMAGDDKPMPITPRQLEGLLRLSQASARARLSDQIGVSDALKAIRIMEGCLRHVAYDPETNQFDIDRVCSPMSKQKRDIITDLKSTIIQIGKGEAVYLNVIYDEMIKLGHDPVKTEKILFEGYDNGAFTSPRRDYFKVM